MFTVSVHSLLEFSYCEIELAGNCSLKKPILVGDLLTYLTNTKTLLSCVLTDVLNSLRARNDVELPGVVGNAINIAKRCLVEDPDVRPCVRKIVSTYKGVFGARQQNMAEFLFCRLQSYGDTLKTAVQARLIDLSRQISYVDDLLTQVMPQYVFYAVVEHAHK